MKTKFYLLVSFIAQSLLVLGLTGCSTGISPDRHLANTRDFMLSQGKPKAYVEGYLDGCSTGRRTAGDKKFSYKRDNLRADKDALYARGWEDGQVCCRNEYIAEQQKEVEYRAESRGVSFSSIDEERNRRVTEESRRADAKVQEIWDELKK